MYARCCPRCSRLRHVPQQVFASDRRGLNSIPQTAQGRFVDIGEMWGLVPTYPQAADHQTPMPRAFPPKRGSRRAPKFPFQPAALMREPGLCWDMTPCLKSYSIDFKYVFVSSGSCLAPA